MEIKGVLLNITINKLHARVAVAIAHQVDVTEYVSVHDSYSTELNLTLKSFAIKDVQL